LQRVTVYAAEPPWAKQAVQMLREAGLDAAYVRLPNPIVQQKSHSLLKIEVSVPSTQALRARQLLRNWELEGEERTRGVGARMVRDLFLSLVPPALVIAAGHRWVGETGADWVSVAAGLVWLASIVLIGKLRRNARSG